MIEVLADIGVGLSHHRFRARVEERVVTLLVATWSGIAGYAAYDWTEQLRTAVRMELFDDPQSVRTVARAPGNRTSLWETTATVQCKIWKGLVARLEYRHDQANEKVFKLVNHGLTPTARNQDTISIDLYYLFF